MTMAEMERRIDALEKRVRELEAQRPWEIHHHYPVQPAQPPQPPEYQPWWRNPIITYTGTI